MLVDNASLVDFDTNKNVHPFWSILLALKNLIIGLARQSISDSTLCCGNSLTNRLPVTDTQSRNRRTSLTNISKSQNLRFN